MIGRDEIVPTYRARALVPRTGRSSGAAGNRTRVPQPRDRASTSIVRGLVSAPAGPRTAAAGT